MFDCCPWNNKFLIGYLALFFWKSLRFPTYHYRSPSASFSIKCLLAALSVGSACICLAAPLPGRVCGAPGTSPTSSSVTQAVRTPRIQLASAAAGLAKLTPTLHSRGARVSHPRSVPCAPQAAHARSLELPLETHVSQADFTYSGSLPVWNRL